MRSIYTHLRNAQELILEETGKEMEIALRVPEDIFAMMYAEMSPSGRPPYDYTRSFKLGTIVIMRETAVIV